MNHSSQANTRTPSGPWGIVGIFVLLLIGANAYYVVPASVFPILTDEFNIGSTQAGLLISVMFGTQMVFGIPVGILIDRVNTRWIVILASVLLIVTYAASWSAANQQAFTLVLITRAIAAPLTAAIWISGISIVSRAFPPATQATAVGVLTGGPPAGFALGLLGGPVLATLINPNAIFLVFTVPILIGCILFWFHRHHIPVHPASTQAPALAEFTTLLTNRSTWIIAGLAFLGFSLYAFGTSWFPSYLTEELGVSLAVSGLIAALFPLVGIVARGASGTISDRLFSHRRRPVGVMSFLVSLPLIIAIALPQSIFIVMLAIVVLGIFVQIGIGLVYSLASEVSETNVAATSVAVTTSLATFGGFIAPIFGGYLIEVAGYNAAFGYAFVVCALGLGLSVFIPKHSRSYF